MKSLANFILESLDEQVHLNDLNDQFVETVELKTSFAEIAKCYPVIAGSGSKIRCVFKDVTDAEADDVPDTYSDAEMAKLLRDSAKHDCEMGYNDTAGVIVWALFGKDGKCLGEIDAEIYIEDEEQFGKFCDYLTDCGFTQMDYELFRP